MLFIVNLIDTYPEAIRLAEEEAPSEQILTYLGDRTCGDWARAARYADQVTVVAGHYDGRIVTAFDVDPEPDLADRFDLGIQSDIKRDPDETLYEIVHREGDPKRIPRVRFHNAGPSHKARHLVGLPFKWRQGLATGWEAPVSLQEFVKQAGGGLQKSVTREEAADLMLREVDRPRATAPRPPIGGDALLDAIAVTRNPRGGVIVEVPSGTNVLVKQV